MPKKSDKLNKDAVLELAEAFVDAEAGVQRKIVKRPTMTEAYAVTESGQRDMLWKDAPDSFKSELSEDARSIYKTVYGKALAKGLEDACMASRDSMDYFKSCARSIGENPIYLTNPMGFTMRQAYKKEKNVTIQSASAGSWVKAQYTIKGNQISVSKQESAIAPNITHSHDSAHMLMVVERMKDRDMSWLLVHDDYATHAGEVTKMNEVIRETFIEIHKEDVLAKVKDQIVEQGADISKIGIEREEMVDGKMKKVWYANPIDRHNDFDLEEVKKSTYFFA